MRKILIISTIIILSLIVIQLMYIGGLLDNYTYQVTSKDIKPHVMHFIVKDSCISYKALNIPKTTLYIRNNYTRIRIFEDTSMKKSFFTIYVDNFQKVSQHYSFTIEFIGQYSDDCFYGFHTNLIQVNLDINGICSPNNINKIIQEICTKEVLIRHKNYIKFAWEESYKDYDHLRLK